MSKLSAMVASNQILERRWLWDLVETPHLQAMSQCHRYLYTTLQNPPLTEDTDTAHSPQPTVMMRLGDTLHSTLHATVHTPLFSVSRQNDHGIFYPVFFTRCRLPRRGYRFSGSPYPVLTGTNCPVRCIHESLLEFVSIMWQPQFDILHEECYPGSSVSTKDELYKKYK